jgi:hypothetical protein
MAQARVSTDPNGQPKTKKKAGRPTVSANRIEGAQDSAPDPFDPDSLRLSQDFASSVGVKRALTVVPCRKPHRQEFVRVRPGEKWRLETGAFEDKINRETYLVDRSMWQELLSDIYPVCLFLTVNRQGSPFLWPVKLPGADGRSNTWNESSLAAARLAEDSWIRVAANMSAGLYDTFQAVGNLTEPEWPDQSFQDMLRLCFQSRFIRDTDHAVLRALRGEA